jgi:hypothetical protein
MLPEGSLSNEQLRTLALEYLKSPLAGSESSHHTTELSTHIGTLAVKLGLIKTTPVSGFRGSDRTMYGVEVEHITQRDVNRVTNVIWDMIIEGLVRPGTGDGRQCDFPFLHLTERGREVANGVLSPYDPDGYLKRLKESIPKLDSTILTYLDECLKGFRVGCTLSSAICIGVASEKAFMLVLDAYSTYLPASDGAAFRKKIEGQSINPQFDAFKSKYEGSLKGELTREVKEGLHTSLYGVFELIRSQRNDAGHPSGKVVERETVYASIVAFPNHLKRMYMLLKEANHAFQKTDHVN